MKCGVTCGVPAGARSAATACTAVGAAASTGCTSTASSTRPTTPSPSRPPGQLRGPPVSQGLTSGEGSNRWATPSNEWKTLISFSHILSD